MKRGSLKLWCLAIIIALSSTQIYAQEKSDKLLLNILPESIAERLKDGAKSCAERFDDVSILFAEKNTLNAVAGFSRDTDFVI